MLERYFIAKPCHSMVSIFTRKKHLGKGIQFIINYLEKLHLSHSFLPPVSQLMKDLTAVEEGFTSS